MGGSGKIFPPKDWLEKSTMNEIDVFPTEHGDFPIPGDPITF